MTAALASIREPDHVVLMDSAQYLFGLSSAANILSDFAHRGDEQRAALRIDGATLIEEWQRLGNLIQFLRLREVK